VQGDTRPENFKEPGILLFTGTKLEEILQKSM
jgi:hypothetical protein